MAEAGLVNPQELNPAQPGPQQNVGNPAATAAVPMDTEPAPAPETQPQPQVPQPAQMTDEQATQHLLRSIFKIGTSSLALQQNQAAQAKLLKTLVDRVEALTTTNTTPRGDSIKQPDPDKFPWAAAEAEADKSLRLELREMLWHLKHFAKDIKFSKGNLINSAGAPQFPDGKWLNILNGRPVDLDHVLSSIYTLSADDKHIEHLGDVELRY
ncbi:hypothetical protein V8D89_006798 [Ganoderma adspersum]